LATLNFLKFPRHKNKKISLWDLTLSTLYLTRLRRGRIFYFCGGVALKKLELANE
jgi:hypothetical protein